MTIRSRRSIGTLGVVPVANPFYGNQGTEIQTSPPEIPLHHHHHQEPTAILAPTLGEHTQTVVPEGITLILDPGVPLHLRNTAFGNENPYMNDAPHVVPSDISTLDCDSVKVDPFWDPSSDTPFVPPLTITITVQTVDPVWSVATSTPPSYDPSLQSVTKAVEAASLTTDEPIARPMSVSRQLSCHPRIELHDISSEEKEITTPPIKKTGTSSTAERSEDEDAHSHFSYYTSPTDLYLSDESQQAFCVSTPSQSGVVKKEFRKMLSRVEAFRRGNRQRKQFRNRSQRAPVLTSHDGDSFASDRGCLI